jgi:hypothetical protein
MHHVVHHGASNCACYSSDCPIRALHGRHPSAVSNATTGAPGVRHDRAGKPFPIFLCTKGKGHDNLT